MSDQLGEVFEKTLQAIEIGKEEIFYIAETSRNETLRLTNELFELKNEIMEIIPQVDTQEKVDHRKRIRLMEVNRDFNKYTQQEMIDAYAEAKDAQVNLHVLKMKESQLRKRRDDLERSLRQMRETIERAQTLMTQVNMAVGLLRGEIEEAISQNNEQRQEMGLRIIRAQEDERRRVAREIHDGPAQTLANIVLRLEIAEKLLEVDPERVKAEVADLKNLVRANLQDIRRIIFDLRPMALDDLGFVPAITKYIDNFRETFKLECELHIRGREKRLLPAMEVALFRLIQEGMNNVAKHAHSPKVCVTLNYQESKTTVQIQDFGQGFEVDETLDTPGEHFGLIGMRERVEMFSGRFSIKSTPGQGTIIKFAIPSVHEEGRDHDPDRDC